MKTGNDGVRLYRVGLRDLYTLRKLNQGDFDTEVFGFHAQQAVEKFLKCWLSSIEIDYPFTHDLRVLFDLLDANKQDTGEFRSLQDLTDFAVFYRYEFDTSMNIRLDRDDCIEQIGRLEMVVRKLGDFHSDIGGE
ncbi:MAG: HEPN domain-containing protein [bacterium]|nr:HEPN domain-containing protein [bacterium]